MTISGIAGLEARSRLTVKDARVEATKNRFESLMDAVQAGTDTATETGYASSGTRAMHDPRLPGDYISSLLPQNPSERDHADAPRGAAANAGAKGTVDRTSKLYEQALELESYFVKIMLSSMRNTVQKSGLSGDSGFASQMYDDMLYDELSRGVTRGAGFGLADQVYLQLASTSLD
jgi:flagellar protein FlgJ